MGQREVVKFFEKKGDKLYYTAEVIASYLKRSTHSVREALRKLVKRGEVERIYVVVMKRRPTITSAYRWKHELQKGKEF